MGKRKRTRQDERLDLEVLWGRNFSAARMEYKRRKGKKMRPRMLGPWCRNYGDEFKDKGMLTLPGTIESVEVLRERLVKIANWKEELTSRYRGNLFDCGYGRFQAMLISKDCREAIDSIEHPGSEIPKKQKSYFNYWF